MVDTRRPTRVRVVLLAVVLAAVLAVLAAGDRRWLDSHEDRLCRPPAPASWRAHALLSAGCGAWREVRADLHRRFADGRERRSAARAAERRRPVTRRYPVTGAPGAGGLELTTFSMNSASPTKMIATRIAITVS